ncbi:hypothetical protein TNCV_4728861 [Trichonephila clavipes]|nr:hypothetical protein TNCV_4728861 [Trichonephila clavipes]
MPLRHFRRQYEQLLQFERGRIIGMMNVGWSARSVAHQLSRSDCVVRRHWDHVVPARVSGQGSRHCWRSPLLHASVLTQRKLNMCSWGTAGQAASTLCQNGSGVAAGSIVEQP